MRHKILVIEDSEDIRENTTELLELSKYCVCIVNNGNEGLDKALQESQDLIMRHIDPRDEWAQFMGMRAPAALS